MGLWFHKYPGTNFHEQNIDWVIESIGALKEEFKDFKEVNQIKYAGAFDITKQYPVWSVVTDNNLGYIAIQNVPAGIPLTNSDYWVEVSDFTPQLANLGNRVSTLEGKVSNLEHDVNILNGIVKSWSGRKVLWVGDSYGNGWDGNTTVTDPYTVASNELGCQFVNISHGATRFGDSSTDPQYLYQTYITDYVNNHSDMNTFTDVIIIGGARDIINNPTADLYDRIGSVISYVKSHFTHAKVHIGMVARLIDTGYSNCTMTNVYRIRDQYFRGAVGHGAEYIHGSELINHDYTLLASDSVHLSSYTRMGERLAQLLASGDFIRDTLQTPNIELRQTTQNDDIAPAICTFNKTEWKGTDVIIDMSELKFTFSTPLSMDQKHLYRFAKISGTNTTRNLFACPDDKWLRFPECGIMKYTENGVQYCCTQPFTFYIYNSYLWLSWNGRPLSGGSASGVQVDEIEFATGIEMTLDEADC